VSEIVIGGARGDHPRMTIIYLSNASAYTYKYNHNRQAGDGVWTIAHWQRGRVNYPPPAYTYTAVTFEPF